MRCTGLAFATLLRAAECDCSAASLFRLLSEELHMCRYDNRYAGRDHGCFSRTIVMYPRLYLLQVIKRG